MSVYTDISCLRTQNFASTVISVTFPRYKPGLCHERLGWRNRSIPGYKCKPCSTEKPGGLLPRTWHQDIPPFLRGVPNPPGFSLRRYCSLPLGSYTITLPQPTHWVGLMNRVILDQGWGVLPGKCPLHPPTSVGGWAIWESGTVDGLQCGSCIDRLGDPDNYWPSLVFKLPVSKVVMIILTS